MYFVYDGGGRGEQEVCSCEENWESFFNFLNISICHEHLGKADQSQVL